MSETFKYLNRRTGKSEDRPLEPSFFQRAYESAAYDSNIDSQRKTAQDYAKNSQKSATSNMPVDEKE